MDYDEIIKLAQSEIVRAREMFPNRDKPWGCRWGGFNRRKKSFGICDWEIDRDSDGDTFYSGVIKLSKYIVRCGYDEILDTIRHEIAHAFAHAEAKHGPEWKAVARKLGATPAQYACAKATQDFQKFEDYKYILIDTLNGAIIKKFYRSPTADYSTKWVRGKPETKGYLRVFPMSQFLSTLDREAKKVIDKRNSQ